MAATLNARPRTEKGKGAARALRRAGRVPAVIYGHGDETRSLSVEALELEKLLATISVENTILELAIEGGDSLQALIREVQRHPARPGILHLDLYQLHAGEKIHLDIPIRLVGTPVGVRDGGGILQEVLRELSVECLPRDIPEALVVDVADLEVGGSIHVRDISAPDVKILNDEDLVVCTVGAPTVQALEEVPEGEAGVGGEVEPELVRGGREAAEAPSGSGQAAPEE